MTLIRLLRAHLQPYWRQVSAVVVLIMFQTVLGLYLPNLTADIINNGIAKGDIPYIWRTGGVMLGVTVVQGMIAIVAVYWASRTSMGVGRDLARLGLRPRPASLVARDEQVRNTVTHHAQHQ